MDYEKKYKEALERARICHKDLMNLDGVVARMAKNFFEEVFPELKESEDERIREEIADYLKKFIPHHDYDLVAKSKQWIAWLENQDEQPYWKPSEEQLQTLHAQLNEGAVTYPEDKRILFTLYEDLMKIVTQEEKQGEQKPTDEVKPKFKVGDWVTQGCNILKIRCVGNEYYCFETVGGYVGDILVSEVDSLYHLWTIQDAKDGDVLVAHECLVLFKEIDRLNIKCHCTYHFMNYSSFYVNTLQNRNPFHPATKEQRDLLFQKMKEAGYVWDSKYKNLKKSEQKPAKQQ